MIGFTNAERVHVVVYMTCAACHVVEAVVFDHKPTPEERIAAMPVAVQRCPFNREVFHDSAVRRRTCT